MPKLIRGTRNGYMTQNSCSLLGLYWSSVDVFLIQINEEDQRERESARGLTIDAHLYSDFLRRLKQNTFNPFVKTTITACCELHV